VTTQSPVPGPAVDHLAAFRRFPVGLVVFLGVFVAAGLYLASRHFGADAVAMCGDETMLPGDQCEQTRRRRRSISTTTTIRSYEEQLTASARAHEAWVWVGVAVAVLAVIVILLVVLRWRSDVALARTMFGQQAPLTAFSTTTGTGVGLGYVIAAAVAGAGLFFGVRAGATDGEIVGIVIAAVGVIAALAIVAASRPKGSTLVWAYDPGARIVTRSTSQDVPWSDLRYFVDLQNDTYMQIGWKGSKHQVLVDDKDFFATMRSKINSTALAEVQQAAPTGEPVDFGAVTLSGRTITFGKKSFDAASLAAINAVKTKEGVELQVRDRSGGTPVTIRPATFANSDVLFHVLHEQFGVVVPTR
jgi:sulfur transfer complex TusBCD TusB component (DsrH family)